MTDRRVGHADLADRLWVDRPIASGGIADCLRDAPELRGWDSGVVDSKDQCVTAMSDALKITWRGMRVVETDEQRAASRARPQSTPATGQHEPLESGRRQQDLQAAKERQDRTSAALAIVLPICAACPQRGFVQADYCVHVSGDCWAKHSVRAWVDSGRDCPGEPVRWDQKTLGRGVKAI